MTRHAIALSFVLVALVALLSLAACSSGPVADMESLVVEFCACNDDGCRDTVNKKIEGWREKNKDKLDSLKDEQKAKLAALGEKWMGCQASVGGSIGAFNKYKSKSQSTEAQMFVKKMIDGARAYYMEEHAGASLTPIARQFPGPSIGPTPPLGECCKQGGKCAPDATQWAAPQWMSLMFSVDDPHYYSYKYELSADGKKVTATAMGDLDCDGDYSTFSLSAAIGEDGEATMDPTMTKEKPLE